MKHKLFCTKFIILNRKLMLLWKQHINIWNWKGVCFTLNKMLFTFNWFSLFRGTNQCTLILSIRSEFTFCGCNIHVPTRSFFRTSDYQGFCFFLQNSHEQKIARNTSEFSRNCIKYMLVQHIWNLRWLLGLFTCHKLADWYMNAVAKSLVLQRQHLWVVVVSVAELLLHHFRKKWQNCNLC